jgi:hypothetical protein
VLLWQGRWDDARLPAAESTHIAEKTHSLFQFCMGRAIVAYAEWMSARKLDSLQRVRQATAWLEPRDSGLFRSLNYGWLADGLVSIGRRQEARHHAARALMRGRKGDLIGVAMAYRALALQASEAHDRIRAERCIELAIRVARTRGAAHEMAVTQLCEARIAQSLGDRPRALALLDRAIPAFEHMGMGWHQAEGGKLLSGL